MKINQVKEEEAREREKQTKISNKTNSVLEGKWGGGARIRTEIETRTRSRTRTRTRRIR